MRKFLIGLCFAALAVPAGATAGGWATVGISPPPDDMGPGQTWDAEMRILQHGVTPLDGVEPIVMISNGPTDKSFTATPTGKPGVYVAKVVFPSRGKWSFRVDDGFSQTHSFAPVSIGVAGEGSGGGGFPTLTVTAVIAAMLGLAALFLLARRLRVRAPAPTH